MAKQPPYEKHWQIILQSKLTVLFKKPAEVVSLICLSAETKNLFE